MTSVNDEKPQLIASQERFIKLVDEDKSQHVKEEILVKEEVLPNGHSHSRIQRQDKQEVAGINGESAKHAEESILTESGAIKEKCHIHIEDDMDKNQHAKEETLVKEIALANGHSHSRIQRQDEREVAEINGEDTRCTKESRLIEDSSTKEKCQIDVFCHIDIIDVSSSKEKQKSPNKNEAADVGRALQAKMGTSIIDGHNEEKTKENKNSATIKGGVTDVPHSYGKAVKVKQKTPKKNCYDGTQSQKKVGDAGNSTFSESFTLSFRKRKLSVNVNCAAKPTYSTKKKQTPLQKLKEQQLGQNKETEVTNQKDENPASGLHSKKVVDKFVVSDAAENCAAIISPICTENKFRIVKTSGQIKLCNTKCVEKGNMDACTVYFGKLPRDVDIYEIRDVFEKVGEVESIRLMLNRNNGAHKGFGFVTFTQAENANSAILRLSGYKIRQREGIVVNCAKENKRIFVANVPKTMSKDDMIKEFSAMTHGLVDVITYNSMDGIFNRGFCFLEYESHRSAIEAKIVLMKETKYKIPLLVDWADPEEEPRDEVMASVKRVYVANLAAATSENYIREQFEAFGAVERVKKIKNYAFVHFEERRCALQAIDRMDGSEFDGVIVKVMLSKPPLTKEAREKILRKREQRMTRYLAASRHLPNRKLASPTSSHYQQKANDRRRDSPSCVQYDPFPVHDVSSVQNLHESERVYRPTTGCSFGGCFSVSKHPSPTHYDRSHLDFRNRLCGSPASCSEYACKPDIYPTVNRFACCSNFH